MAAFKAASLPVPGPASSSEYFRDPERCPQISRDSNGKPVPLSFSDTDKDKKLVIRQAPGSPVMLSFQTGTFAQPINADIEHARPGPVSGSNSGTALSVDPPRVHDTNSYAMPLSQPSSDIPPPPPPHAVSPRLIAHALAAADDSPKIGQSLPVVAAGGSSPALASPTAYAPGTGSRGPRKVLPHDQQRQQQRGQDAGYAEPADPRPPSAEGPARQSTESDTTPSTHRQQQQQQQQQQQHASGDSSATTSASSDNWDCPEVSVENSSKTSTEEENEDAPVQTFQYHHQAQHQPRQQEKAGQFSSHANAVQTLDPRASSQPDLLSAPPSQYFRRNSLGRPRSMISMHSPRSSLASPVSYGRVPSATTLRNSPDHRYSTYVDLLRSSYPQPSPAPISLDNSGLRSVVGNNASLLSTQKTLEMYRQNVKKTSDPEIQYAFAIFLISTAQEMGIDHSLHDRKRRGGKDKGKERAEGDKDEDGDKDGDKDKEDDEEGLSALEFVKEARVILQKLAKHGYPFAQYYLADGYSSGLFSKGKEDYGMAFPLFVLAAKHGHVESAYRTALCYEFGAGCRRDPGRAVQFLRSAAAKGHPGAMFRLGQACLSGDLGERRYREGIKWMKLATEAADTMYNQAPYQLARMYETGDGVDVFRDEAYAAALYTQAAGLGHVDASFRMGQAYEHGELECPRDPALSVHFYTGAAERGHVGAMMGLCAWYMVGADRVLEQDHEEAYEWARRAAETGYAKAQYAVAYFTEMGIGCRRDILEANVWYVRAADQGDQRAKQRLKAIRAAASGGAPAEVPPQRIPGKLRRNGGANAAAAGGKEEGQCRVM